ncbi:hypothetical protein RB653_004046 [Dictyostelium firmibasis]|uniref:Peroxin-7 n=1 Tax=Dictyostelium firmibasis TaxID=79012 RepID=A0AAN7U6Q7_9MYCE
MKRFHSHFNGYSVEFSPFEEQRMACVTSQHFGIIGNGRQYILDVLDRDIGAFKTFDTRDGLYDCSWSEENECHVASSSGDGSIKIWDTQAPSGGRPIKSFEEHTKEVYSVDWNLVTKDTFITGSWDQSIKIWNPRTERSLKTFREHRYCIYSAIWSPRNAHLFASVSGDRTLKIWDSRDTRSLNTIKAHDHEILTCDWNKYNDKEIVTGSVDKTIRIWDIRYPDRPTTILRGHTYAVRRIKCSPHSESMLASCSYDMSVIVWDRAREQDPILARMDHHTEFVVGLDWNMFIDGQMASCSWDEQVCVWNLGRPGQFR